VIARCGLRRMGGLDRMGGLRRMRRMGRVARMRGIRVAVRVAAAVSRGGFLAVGGGRRMLLDMAAAVGVFAGLRR
jgi:L-alanine-DL-glutamate epimerase-like enolase superfamily enzyme